MNDYLAMGVKDLWCFDAEAREARRYTAEGFPDGYGRGADGGWDGDPGGGSGGICGAGRGLTGTLPGLARASGREFADAAVGADHKGK